MVLKREEMNNRGDPSIHHPNETLSPHDNLFLVRLKGCHSKRKYCVDGLSSFQKEAK